MCKGKLSNYQAYAATVLNLRMHNDCKLQTTLTTSCRLAAAGRQLELILKTGQSIPSEQAVSSYNDCLPQWSNKTVFVTDYPMTPNSSPRYHTSSARYVSAF